MLDSKLSNIKNKLKYQIAKNTKIYLMILPSNILQRNVLGLQGAIAV